MSGCAFPSIARQMLRDGWAVILGPLYSRGAQRTMLLNSGDCNRLLNSASELAK